MHSPPVVIPETDMIAINTGICTCDPTTFARAAHLLIEKRQYQRHSKPKPLLLASGLGLTLFGTIMLIAKGRKLSGAKIFPTVILTCAWCALTGVGGLCAACWCPNGGVLLECHGDISKCKKRSTLICYRVYIWLILVQIFLSISLMIHAAVVGTQTDWIENRGADSALYILLSSAFLFVCPFLIWVVKFDRKTFIVHHSREHGRGILIAAERDTLPVSDPAPEISVDTLSLTPPYCEQFGRALLPTYEMAEAEQPLLCSTLTIENGVVIEMPPSYTQVFESSQY